jgi:hypothetical protein
MKILVAFPIFFLVISCCESSTQVEETTKKYYSGEKTIDLNDDGKDDVRWELRYIGNGHVIDAIFTVWKQNNAKILYSPGRPLFEIGDTIKFEISQPFFWSPFPSDLAWLRTNTRKWGGRWVGKTAYLPIKIAINDAMHCGWINLTMDTVNQKLIFNYSDYNIEANSDFIIID